MKDAHVAWRTSIGLLALIVAFALPAAAQTPPAQPRTPQEVDQAVAEQQKTIDRLSKELGDIRKNQAAPPDAWKALGTVGLTFVLAWLIVAVVREFTSAKETQAETQQAIRAAITQQAELIESAANARIKALAELLREARTQPTPPVAAGATTSLPDLVRELFGLGKPVR